MRTYTVFLPLLNMNTIANEQYRCGHNQKRTQPQVHVEAVADNIAKICRCRTLHHVDTTADGRNRFKQLSNESVKKKLGAIRNKNDE